ncbi:uncharacterized protein [Drosophila kikkawai]|uniref:Uncharacterized protein n=1 Tax=Drosophila kikkawai TaxID=30033 RepID=A0ABM4GCR4_DROKI
MQILISFLFWPRNTKSPRTRPPLRATPSPPTDDANELQQKLKLKIKPKTQLKLKPKMKLVMCHLASCQELKAGAEGEKESVGKEDQDEEEQKWTKCHQTESKPLGTTSDIPTCLTFSSFIYLKLK